MNDFWLNLILFITIPTCVFGFMAGLVWLDIKVTERIHDDDDC